MPLFLPYFLFFLPLFFFLSVLFLLLISNYYLVVGCFPFGLFFFWVPLSRCLLLSYHRFSPQVPPPPQVSFLSVFFFSLPCFFLPPPPPISIVVTFLLQRTDLMRFLPFTPRASLIVFGLLWASFQDYSSTHWLPLPLLSTCLLHHYSFHEKIPFCLFVPFTHTYTSRLLTNKDWATSLPSSIAYIRWS